LSDDELQAELTRRNKQKIEKSLRTEKFKSKLLTLLKTGEITIDEASHVNQNDVITFSIKTPEIKAQFTGWMS
jgi:hypothetical protein